MLSPSGNPGTSLSPRSVLVSSERAEISITFLSSPRWVLKLENSKNAPPDRSIGACAPLRATSQAACKNS